MKNIIIIFEGESNQFDNLEEVIEYIFGKEYMNLQEDEKLNARYRRAFPICKYANNIDIVNTKHGVIKNDYEIVSNDYNIEQSFIIDTEITYILSLCRILDILILENVNSNIFTSMINKENIEDNYIVLNTFANQILEQEVKNND